MAATPPLLLLSAGAEHCWLLACGFGKEILENKSEQQQLRIWFLLWGLGFFFCVFVVVVVKEKFAPYQKFQLEDIEGLLVFESLHRWRISLNRIKHHKLLLWGHFLLQ